MLHMHGGIINKHKIYIRLLCCRWNNVAVLFYGGGEESGQATISECDYAML